MSPEELFDPVKRPAHYVRNGMEAIDVIEAFAPDNYHRGNALKYLLRADNKGATVQDLHKAIWYIEREISKAEPSVTEAAYPAGCEKCKGWTWNCHKHHHTGEYCSHKCEYPITMAEHEAISDKPLDWFCVPHQRWHRGTCGDCYVAALKAGSSR